MKGKDAKKIMERNMKINMAVNEEAIKERQEKVANFWKSFNRVQIVIAVAMVMSALIISGLTVIAGISLHAIGSHNVDLGQNMRWLNAEFHLNLTDQYNLQGDTMDGGEWIILGNTQQRYALRTTMYGSFFFGLLFMIVLGLVMALYASKWKKEDERLG